MGNTTSANDEDFSKTIDFCKQLRLLHFVVNEPRTYSETYTQFQTPSIDVEGGEGVPRGLRSQHKELTQRIGEIDFAEYRLMFSIRRILFSAPFRGSIIGYDLVAIEPGGRSRQVKYIICFDTHEHRPPTTGAHQDVEEGAGGIKSYRTKRSYSEFLQLDDRIRNLFSTRKERQAKRQFEAELDRRDSFMRQLEKDPSSLATASARAPSGTTSSSSTPSSRSRASSSASDGRRPSIDEVQLEDDLWIYVKPKQTLSPKRGGQLDEAGAAAAKEGGDNNDGDDGGDNGDDNDDDEGGYESLHLPPLPGKQFCWDDASRLALAETRMPLLDAYLQAVFASPYLVNHEVFLRFLFSPDSFGADIEVDDDEVTVAAAAAADDQQQVGGKPRTAEAVLTPTTRQRSDYKGAVSDAALVEDYEGARHGEAAEEAKPPQRPGTGRSPSSRRLTNSHLIIIDEWERQGEAEKEVEVEQDASSVVPPQLQPSLEQSLIELFGTSPFYSLMNSAPGRANAEAQQGCEAQQGEVELQEITPPRDVRDDWSFLCVEMAICKRHRSRKQRRAKQREQSVAASTAKQQQQQQKKKGEDKRKAEMEMEEEDEEEEVLQLLQDSETRRFIERTRTLELAAKLRSGRPRSRSRPYATCEAGLPRAAKDDVTPSGNKWEKDQTKKESEEANEEEEGEDAEDAEDGWRVDEEDEEEERQRHKRVMSRLHEAEEWVNQLDGGRRKKRRRWRVTNVESYVLATGTGELPSALQQCLEKQAKAMVVAHGLASGKTGAIIASKKGAATLLHKSLAVLGVTASREANLMMAACLQLALSRVLLFLRLNSVESYLSSHFFIHSSTYIGQVAAISAINSAKLIAKANMLSGLVAFLVEEIYLLALFLRIWRVNGERGINLRHFMKSTAVNLASNTSAYAGAIAGGTIGTLIEPGGGTIIGSLLGGIMCGLLVSLGCDYVYAKWYGEDDDEDGEEEVEGMEMVELGGRRRVGDDDEDEEDDEDDDDDEEWEQLQLNANLWEDLVAEFEKLDGNEYEPDTIDDIVQARKRAEAEAAQARTKKQTTQKNNKKKKGSTRKRSSSATSSSSSSGAVPTAAQSKWSRVITAARRRRKPSKASTRSGTRSHDESSQSAV